MPEAITREPDVESLLHDIRIEADSERRRLPGRMGPQYSIALLARVAPPELTDAVYLGWLHVWALVHDHQTCGYYWGYGFRPSGLYDRLVEFGLRETRTVRHNDYPALLTAWTNMVAALGRLPPEERWRLLCPVEET